MSGRKRKSTACVTSPLQSRDTAVGSAEAATKRQQSVISVVDDIDESGDETLERIATTNALHVPVVDPEEEEPEEEGPPVLEEKPLPPI